MTLPPPGQTLSESSEETYRPAGCAPESVCASWGYCALTGVDSEMAKLLILCPCGLDGNKTTNSMYKKKMEKNI